MTKTNKFAATNNKSTTFKSRMVSRIIGDYLDTPVALITVTNSIGCSSTATVNLYTIFHDKIHGKMYIEPCMPIDSFKTSMFNTDKYYRTRNDSYLAMMDILDDMTDKVRVARMNPIPELQKPGIRFPVEASWLLMYGGVGDYHIQLYGDRMAIKYDKISYNWYNQLMSYRIKNNDGVYSLCVDNNNINERKHDKITTELTKCIEIDPHNSDIYFDEYCIYDKYTYDEIMWINPRRSISLI